MPPHLRRFSCLALISSLQVERPQAFGDGLEERVVVVLDGALPLFPHLRIIGRENDEGYIQSEVVGCWNVELDCSCDVPLFRRVFRWWEIHRSGHCLCRFWTRRYMQTTSACRSVRAQTRRKIAVPINILLLRCFLI